MHRQGFIGLAGMGCYLALKFDEEDPEETWCWGTPLKNEVALPKPKEDSFWLNFTEATKEYDPKDDMIVYASKLPIETYAKEWAVVAPIEFTSASPV